MRKANILFKSDERILRDSDFVSELLTQANEDLERKYAFRLKGIDLDWVAGKVAALMEMPVEDMRG